MFLDSHGKNECCGCSACASICPSHVINMQEDIEGFEYPVIVNEEACIHCDLCKKVCPIVNRNSDFKAPRCYMGWLENLNERRLSTSGGAFIAIAEAAYRDGFEFFFGASYDSQGSVRHIGVQFEQVNTLRGTKYVQSSLKNIFVQVKKHLENNKKVLFVGTPCQVAGLQNYVGNTLKEQLLTVSLVCHGVASPAAFKKYCDEMGNEQHGKVNQVIFRDKKDGNLSNSSGYTTLVYEDGHRESDAINPYTTTFGLGLMQRPSCSDCCFTTIYRESDLTIGDFWGIDDFQPELSSELKEGISLLLVHTKAGDSIISKLQGFHLVETPIEWAINEKQPQLLHPHEKNIRRDRFLKNVLDKDISFIKSARKEVFRWRVEKKVRSILKKV